MDLAVAGGVDANGNATLTIYLADSQSGTLPATNSPVVPSTTVNIGAYNSVDAVVAGKFRSPTQTAGKTIYDLAVFSAGQIFVLPSNGDGTFGPVPSYSFSLSADPNYPGFYYSPRNGHPFAAVLTAVNVNGDGPDDIVLTLPEYNCHASGSVSQGAVYVLLSNGNGTFQNPVFVPPPVVNPVSVTAANFFGTGRNDLVFADGGEICKGNTATTTGTAVGILKNNVPLNSTTINSSEFTAATILPQSSDAPVPNITAVASADLNGDGHPDLVVSNTNGIQVLLNQGGGSFLQTPQSPLPLYAGDSPGVLCTGSFVGCVTYDSQVAIGSFFAIGENDVAASVGGVVYIFQNLGNSGILQSPTQGFVAGPDSTVLSAALVNSSGLNNLLVATSQGTAYLVNNSQGTATGRPQPPVIMKAFGVTSMPVVDVTSLTFTIINPNSNTPLTEIAFTDIFPAGLGVATPSNLTNTCGGTATATAGLFQVSLSGAMLAASTSCTLTVNVTGTAAGPLTNSVTVSANESGSAMGTSSASITLFMPNPPSIYKYFGVTSIPLGGVTTLNFTISNLNYNTGLTGIGFTDTFPAGLAVATPSYLSSTCGGTATATAGSSSVSLAGGALAVGSFCEITVNVIGTQAGTLDQ